MSRILVVEDDADIASLIVHYLAPAGHESEVVANGSDALAAARRRPPDLVILDRMLPGLDGLEICRALRADAEMGAVPILMLTARAEEVESHRRLRDRRRRLRHQAVQPEGAGRPHRCAAPPPPARPGRRTGAALRPARRRRRPARRHRRRARSPAHGQGVPAAPLFPRAPRPRAVARPAALGRVGLSVHRRHAHGRRPRAAAARKAARPRQAVETIKQFGYKLKTEGATDDAAYVMPRRPRRTPVLRGRHMFAHACPHRVDARGLAAAAAALAAAGLSLRALDGTESAGLAVSPAVLAGLSAGAMVGAAASAAAGRPWSACIDRGSLRPGRLIAAPAQRLRTTRRRPASARRRLPGPGRPAGGADPDRARMEAILSGMVEGVLVINEQGRPAGQRGRPADPAPRRSGGPPLRRAGAPAGDGAQIAGRCAASRPRAWS